MSPKKPRRNPLELVREPPAVEEPLDERFSVHHLTGELHDTLEAIISGCAFLARDPVPPELLDPDRELEAIAAELRHPSIDGADAEMDKMRDIFGGVSL